MTTALEFKSIPKQFKSYGHWKLWNEDFLGAWFFGHEDNGFAVWCTPDFEGLNGIVSIEVRNGDNEDVEITDFPYDGTPEGWFAGAKPFLDKYGKVS